MSKGNGGSISVINPSGASLVVTITRGTATPTVYTTENLTDTYTMPLTATESTTFWFADAGEYTVSVVENGDEIADGRGGTVTYSLVGGNGVGFTPGLDPSGLPSAGLRIPAADEVGLPLGRDDDEALDELSAAYRVVWTENDDTGVVFSAGAVDFPDQSAQLLSGHDRLRPATGIYRWAWTLTMTAGAAASRVTLFTPGAGATTKHQVLWIPATEEVTVSDSGIALIHQEDLDITVAAVSADLTVGNGTFYLWKIS